ncbi:bifunctional sterol desaturase/short chain dehydrogenase [cyanobacterium endosymbiont of Epithemia turgida]|uniref:bifunctional sterol desaturase/short chain dehydrogenase n=1 Tax=cyanobacterium endosymbiont of Epithemia turgida TaxID=718217 RepID=UPI0004D139F7|nr:bifunctional sterol desaturase/short chain dehydrogenase [cyanobacterium endosymbiont of Epithemia turgida]BAP17474.1 bifunctional sterol desaturase/short chain dehydrogenase [cyanobacterium endosymbiont of Epithemia turgida isolate EtSB Lake Yunoko]
MLSDIITTISLLLGSVLWVEIVRDCHHTLSHHWIPLYRLHAWHHRVFRPDLSPVSEEIYRKAHWYNDLPEALVMLTLSLIFGTVFFFGSLPYSWMAWGGSVYALTFLIGAITRGVGVPYADELTDITHRQGEFVTLPGKWFVNRPYHWRHHFDNQKAYYSGTLTLVDKLMGTALSLKRKTVAVTGASGTLGQSLLKQLYIHEAIPIAFTSKHQSISIEIEDKRLPIKTLTWQVGKELELIDELESVDILILNHGINVYSERTPEAINKSYEVNTFSSLRLMELFITTIRTNKDRACKEVWVNTSEAEVSPAVSPLYELSKRALGDLVTLRRLDAPCVVRKLVLGPFKSNLNPIGLMSGDLVAKHIMKAAKADNRNIIITVNPLTFIVFPLKEFFVSLYFKLFSKKVNQI